MSQIDRFSIKIIQSLQIKITLEMSGKLLRDYSSIDASARSKSSHPHIPRLDMSQLQEGDFLHGSSGDKSKSNTTSKNQSYSGQRQNSIANFELLDGKVINGAAGPTDNSVKTCLASAKQAIVSVPQACTFDSRNSRLGLSCMFVAAIIPSFVFHVALKIQLRNADQNSLEQDFNITKDETYVTNSSLTQVSLSFFILVTSAIFIQCESKLLSKKMPAILNMVGLTGLLPIQGARMPSYPLWTGSMLIFATMTGLNLLFLARKAHNRVIISVILTLYVILLAIKRFDRIEASSFFSEINFDQRTSVLVCESLSLYYGLHQATQLILAFIILVFVSQNMERSKFQYNKIVKMNLDRMYECMGQENQPYIVSKVIENIKTNANDQPEKITPDQEDEIGYEVSYISKGFERLILRQLGCSLDDLIFRHVEKCNVYDEEFESSDDNSNFTRPKSISVADKYLEGWVGRNALILNMKQLIDQISQPASSNQSIFEIKCKQQVKIEKQMLILAREKENNKNIQIHRLNDPSQVNIEEEKQQNSQSGSQLIQDFPISNLLSEQQRDNASSSHKLMEKIERRYVKIRITKTRKNGQSFKVLTCKQVLEPKKVEIKNAPSKRCKSSTSKRLSSKLVSKTSLNQSQQLEQDDNQEEIESNTDIAYSDNTNQTDRKTNTLNKLAKLVFKQLPEQLEFISLIQHCAEGICFDLNKLMHQKAGSSSLQNFMSKGNLKNASSESSLLQPNKQLIRNDSQGNLKLSVQKFNSKSLNKSPLLPEIEYFASSLRKSAQMLSQTFESAIICHKLIQKKMFIDYYQHEGGPRKVMREASKAMAQIIEEKEMAVQITCDIKETEDLSYFWRAYKSIVYHALLWSVTHSECNQNVFVDIGLEWAIEGQHCEAKDMQKGGLISPNPRGERGGDEDDIDSLHMEKFLRTDIFFRGNKDFICNRQYQRTMVKDCNWQMVKLLTTAMGGRKHQIIAENFGAVQIVLPIDDLYDQQALIEKNDLTEQHRWPSMDHKMRIFSVIGRKLLRSLAIAKGFDYSATVIKNKSSTLSSINDIKLSFGFKESSIADSSQEVDKDKNYVLRKSQTIQVREKSDPNSIKYAKNEECKKRQSGHIIKLEELQQKNKVSSDQQSSHSSFKSSELSSSNHSNERQQLLIKDRKQQEVVAKAMQQEKLNMQKEIMGYIDEDNASDRNKDDKGNRKSKAKGGKSGSKQFREPAIAQLIDKSESLSRKQNMGYRRLNTIREEDQSEMESKSAISGASDYAGMSFDRARLSQSKSDKNDKSKQEDGDQVLVTVSSYQMSIELNDENIGEATHNMHDGLFKPLVPTSHVNYLVKNQKDANSDSFDQAKPQDKCQQPIRRDSAPDKEIIEDAQQIISQSDQVQGDNKKVVNLRRQNFMNKDEIVSQSAENHVNPKLQLLEPVEKPKNQLLSEQQNDNPNLSNQFSSQDKSNSAINEQQEEKKQEFKLEIVQESGIESENLEDSNMLVKGAQKFNSSLQEEKRSIQSHNRSESQSVDGPGSDHEDQEYCECQDSCLIVDDTVQNIVPLKMMIKQLLNINVETATNGQHGFEKYETDLKKTCCKKYYHFILMDLQMPVLDGMQATEKIIKLHAEYAASESNGMHISAPLVIAVTAFRSHDSHDLALANGMKDILFKPLKLKEIKDCLKRTLTPEHLLYLQK